MKKISTLLGLYETVFAAVMHTQNYVWVAVGATDDEARDAVRKKFNSRTGNRWSTQKLEEEYGIHTEELKSGECAVW